MRNTIPGALYRTDNGGAEGLYCLSWPSGQGAKPKGVPPRSSIGGPTKPANRGQDGDQTRFLPSVNLGQPSEAGRIMVCMLSICLHSAPPAHATVERAGDSITRLCTIREPDHSERPEPERERGSSEASPHSRPFPVQVSSVDPSIDRTTYSLPRAPHESAWEMMDRARSSCASGVCTH